MTAKKVIETHLVSDFYTFEMLYTLLRTMALIIPDGADAEQAYKTLTDIVAKSRCILEDGIYYIAATDIVTAVTGTKKATVYLHGRIHQNDDFANFYKTNVFAKAMHNANGNNRSTPVCTLDNVVPLINLLPLKSTKQLLFGITPPPKIEKQKRNWHRVTEDEIVYRRRSFKGQAITVKDIEYGKQWAKKNLGHTNITTTTPELLTEFAQKLSLSKAQYVLRACKEKAERDGLKFE